MTTSKGTVFDIKRFATHDGNGIRTTVFLKGCSLKCVWCQNPEGINPQPQLLYFSNKCIHCGTCASLANQGGIKFVKEELQLHREAKEDWKTIVDACPTMAIRYDSKIYESKEVLDEVCKDMAFFRYGGGLTISGGEPFVQVDFLEAILKEAKRRGIHTAIETTLHTSRKNVDRILPYIDQMYCDCKLFDSSLHQKYTHVDNALILENISYVLKKSGDKVIVRTPLIPRMTATEDNIAKISRFLSNCFGEVRYELLNYNPLAKSKYSYLDMEYCFDENPKLYTKAEMEHFYQVARENGIKNLIIE